MTHQTEGGVYRRWIAIALFGAMAIIVLVGLALERYPPQASSAGWLTAVMGLFTAISILAAYTFPIHIGYHTKLAMTTVPLFLTAALLPVPVAVGVAAGATLLAELMVRRERGNLPTDIAITTLRWAAIVLVAALIVSIPAANRLGETARLLAAALVMFVGDALTAAWQVAQLSRESPGPVLRALMREAAVVELVQYVLGLLGAFAALEHFWAPVLLLLPIAIIYIAFKNAKELQDTTRQFLETMADAVDLRDPGTGGHSRRVGELCAGILRQMGLHGPEADLIVSAARVHDIGKIGTPDSILLKTGKLNRDELKIMQVHAEQGAAMLLRYRDFARGADFVRHHHESWDGRGYPAGLLGSAIPFGARVIAVADSYDAMTSNRPYRGPMTPNDAARILRAGRGSQWDATVVDAFLAVIGERLEIPEGIEPPISAETNQFSTRVSAS